MEGAVFSGNNVDSCPDQLLGGNFRSKCVTLATAESGHNPYEQEFRITFPEAIGIVTVFVQGYCAGDGNDFASLVGSSLYFNSDQTAFPQYNTPGVEITSSI